MALGDTEVETGLGLPMLIHIMYGLFALALLSGGLFGLASVAAVVLAYMKRGAALGTIHAAHIDWLIASFWWGALWLLLSAIGVFIYIGWLSGLVAMVWLIYRVAKGWLAHFEGETPLPGF